MKHKKSKKWKPAGKKGFGPPSPGPMPDFKLRTKLKKMFRMNYDGK